MKFYLADHSWLLIRPSGTEPDCGFMPRRGTVDMRDALLKMGSEMGKKVI
ncbi:MAG: hypothetical protein R3E39_14165 [Anaerolineae bacterium]